MLILAVTLASCLKTETGGGPAVSFQVAGNSSLTRSYQEYRIGYGDVPFGAYAWFKGNEIGNDSDFMVNQKVSYNTERMQWLPEGKAYFWPRSGTLDFICYSPYMETPPTIGEDRIIFGPWNPTETPGADLMYADKASGLSQNPDAYYYTDVPVRFHHALAKLRFNISLAWAEADNGSSDKTRWEVDIQSAKLRNIHESGTLTLMQEGGEWALPDNRVWQSSGSVKDIDLNTASLTSFTDTQVQTLADGMLVMPQEIVDGCVLEMVATIRTYSDRGDGYKLILTENPVQLSAQLKNQAITSWRINQFTTYSVRLAPSLPQEGYTGPVTVNFDPAVESWASQTVTITVGLGL